MKKVITKIVLLFTICIIYVGSTYAYNIEVKPGRISSMPNSNIAFRMYVSDGDVDKKTEQNVWNYSNGKSNIKIAGKLSINEIYFHTLPNVNYNYNSKQESYGYVNYLSIVNERENKASEITKLPLTSLTKMKSENIFAVLGTDGFKEYRFRNEDDHVYAVDYILPYAKYLELLNKAAYDKDVIYFTMPLSMQNRVYESSEELYQSAIDAENLKGDSDKNITSGINYYDNIMYLPTFTNRQVYIRHIDVSDPLKNNTTLTTELVEKAPKLLGNQNIAVSDTRHVVSAIKNETGYQEKYDIASISNAVVNYSNNSTYDYLGYAMTKSTSKEEAKEDMERQIEHDMLQNLNDSKTVNLVASNVDDCIFIDFYYKQKEGNEALDDINNITGRLSVESMVKEYKTDGTEDFIPSNSKARVGFTDADLYKIGGINYEENSNKLNIEVTINKKYKTKDEPELNKVKSETFKYTINYSLYKLNNFKLFKISKFELYDRASNVGGKLFANTTDTTVLNVNNNFKDKFDNFSSEVNKKNIEVKMDQKTYAYESNTKDKVILSHTIDLGVIDNDDKALLPTRADVPQITAIFKNDSLIVNGQPLLDGSSGTAIIQNGYLDKTNVVLPGFDTWSYYSANEVRPRTTIADFTDKPIPYGKDPEKLKYEELSIASDTINGLRKLTGKVYYDIITDTTYGRGNLNVGTDDFTDSLTNKKVPIAGVSKEIKDTETEDNVDDVIVQTPIVINASITQDKVWHYEQEIPSSTIQKNGKISVRLSHMGDHSTYGKIDTVKNVYADFVKFDFDVIVRGECINFKKDDFVSAGKWIQVKPGESLGVSIPDKEFNNILNIDKNTVTVKTIAINYREKPFNSYVALMNNTLEAVYEEEMQNSKTYDSKYNDGTIKEANYVVYNKLDLQVANRIYDFKVTNIKDSIYEGLFKDGFAFYSGTKQYTPYSYENYVTNRKDIVAGQTLPIGPTSLIGNRDSRSPEIGSKISFDLKTTGRFGYLSDEALRHIEIVPEYYYVDAAGDKIYTEEGINLYYKDDKGKYVELGSDKDTFRIKMTPRDGLRTSEATKEGFNTSNMSTYELEIGNYKKLTLNKSNMAVGQNDFVQVWYGEYYLPASTIVVPANIKNPKDSSALKTGYLMVKFNIKSIEKDGKVLSYQSNLSEKNKTNNEWSIEGYTEAFQLVNKKYSIKKEDLTNKLTGTVLIYDLSK